MKCYEVYVLFAEPLNDQFRRASMRRKSSKRYRPDRRGTPDRPAAPRMGLRVTPPRANPNPPHIPPLDGSPPDGWARPYPSPTKTPGAPNPNQNPFFRDNRAYSGSPNDPEGEGHRPRSSDPHRTSRASNDPRVNLQGSNAPHRMSQQSFTDMVDGQGQRSRLDRPPSYKDLIELGDIPDVGMSREPRQQAADQMSQPPAGKIHFTLDARNTRSAHFHENQRKTVVLLRTQYETRSSGSLVICISVPELTVQKIQISQRK